VRHVAACSGMLLALRVIRMAKIAGGDYRWKWHGRYQQTLWGHQQIAQTERRRMPAPRKLDPEQSPAHFFGAEFRKAREAAKMSQGVFGATVPCDISTVSRVENGELSPSDAFLDATLKAFPELGLLVRFYRASRVWNAGSGPVPAWFEEWLRAETQAEILRYWSPLILPALFHTDGYARALLVAAQTDISDEAINALVAARLARAAILDRADPPEVVAVIDELALGRLIGSPEIMREQLEYIAELSARPYVCVQVVPASVGATAGMSGDICLASGDGSPDVLHTDAVPEGHTSERRSQVRAAAVAFERIRQYALPNAQSRELILKVAEEQWNV
jgi:transcriptional regulator with XRE-family HTH domain